MASESEPGGGAAPPAVAAPPTATAETPAPPKPKPARKPFVMPTVEQMMQEELMNNCAVKMVLSGVMGGLMGGAMGIAMGGYEGAAGTMLPDGTFPKQTVKEAVVNGFKSAAKGSWSWMKTFSGLGAAFAVSECLIEKGRAKHDIWNAAGAGCVSGGGMAIRGGPTAIMAGCASFAAFSMLMEKLMVH